MDKELDGMVKNTEVRLWEYCNRLERNNKAVNVELENLISFAQKGYYNNGNYDKTSRTIKQNCNFCKELLKIELQIVSMIESTLHTLTVGNLLKK